MQSGKQGAIAARSAQFALGAAIASALMQTIEALRASATASADVAGVSVEDAGRQLTEIEGALGLAGQSGLRVLTTHLRMRLLPQDAVPAAQSGSSVPAIRLADAVDALQALARVLAWAFERLLQQGEVLAADLRRCWQRQTLPDFAGAPATAELLSLQLAEGVALPLLALLPSLPCADPLADAERALLACLRADDDGDRYGAVRAFADVLAATALQASCEAERNCWLILHACLRELAQAIGPLATSDKKLLAAIVRALRHRHQVDLMAVLEPLACEALSGLSSPCLQTEAGLGVARTFRLDLQLTGTPEEESPQRVQHDAQASFGAAVASKITLLDGDAERLSDAAIWYELADLASHAPHLLMLADPLRRLAAQASALQQPSQRELSAALLLALQAWSADHGADVGVMAAVLERASQGDTALASDALIRQVQASGARQRRLDLCSAIAAELTAAEQWLEAAWQSGDAEPALAAVDEVLAQVAGALALCGFTADREDFMALRALLSAALRDTDLRQALHPVAVAWTALAASIAALPSQQILPADVPLVIAAPPPSMSTSPAAQAAAADQRLRTIFLDEAGGHLRSLRRLVADDPAAQENAAALRAVHTLAGCSATMGQPELAALAQALEDYLMTAGWQAPGALLADALDGLDCMLDEFATEGRCTASPALLARLQSAGTQRACADRMHDAFGSAGECAGPVADIADEVRRDKPGDLPLTASTQVQTGIDTDCDAQPAMPSHTPSPAQRPCAAIEDGAAEELQAIFDEEAADLLPQLEQAMQAWQQHPDGREPPMQLLRVLHTLKGSARMAGRHALGDEFHQAEADVASLAQQSPFDVLQDLPQLQERIERWLQWGMPAVPDTVVPDSGALPALLDTDAGTTMRVHNAAGAVDDAGITEAETTAAAGTPAARSADVSRTTADAPTLRVAAGQLARIADTVAALWAGNASIRDAVQDQRHVVAALSGDLSRLRAQLRELEIESESRILSRASQGNEAGFDPLEFDRYTRLHELTRMMAESIADLSGVQRGLARQTERLASAASMQLRDMRACQLEVQAMRSQPLRAIEPRLRYLLRNAARDAGREAELVLSGGDVEIERSLLDRLGGPFGHLLRNAVVHGIEPPSQRIALGKPPKGTVTIAAALASNELRLSLRDDGRGLDLGQMRSSALAAGLLSIDDMPDDAALAALIFAPGLSTASAITPLSGRGIGMDAVRVALQALGGRIEVDSEPGQGCRFTITLPLALVSLPVLLASAGSRRIALPVARVRQIVQPGPGQIERGADGQQMLWRGKRLPLLHLGRALGDTVGLRDDEAARLPVAIVQEGERLLALQLDAVAGQRDVMVKHPGPQLARVPGIAGATLLGDGGIALILDPFRMPATPVKAAPPAPERPLVLVVDDSLTVRRASQRLLERHGYAVALARDGIEALERLSERRPTALLLDIEMPRMDGFELLATLRADAVLCGLPVLMITSRIAERHRERAQQLGVLAYLGKPFDEDALLAALAGLSADAPLAA